MRPCHHHLGHCVAAILVLTASHFLAAPALAEPYPLARQTVAGSAIEMGSTAGRANAAALRELQPMFLAVATAATHLSRNDLYARAAAVAGHMAKDDLAQIKAMAVASEMPYEDVLFLNVFYSLTSGPFACRQIALWGKNTSEGQILHARNLDWPDYPGQPLERHNLLLDCRPKEGIEYLNFTWPGFLGVITGTNRQGLTVAFNTLPASRNQERTSEPTFFTLARVLRTCKTLEEAIDCIRKAAPLDNGSVMISSTHDGQAVVVEIMDGEIGVRHGYDAIIGNANLPTHEAGLKGLHHVMAAEPPACVIVRTQGGIFDATRLAKVMGDPRVLMPINLLSVVLDPAHNEMLVSCGHSPAATGPFEKLAIFPPTP